MSSSRQEGHRYAFVVSVVGNNDSLAEKVREVDDQVTHRCAFIVSMFPIIYPIEPVSTMAPKFMGNRVRFMGLRTDQSDALYMSNPNPARVFDDGGGAGSPCIVMDCLDVIDHSWISLRMMGC